MKIILLITVLGITFFTNGQKAIHFEQIAFEYYKDSILNKYQPKNEITISSKIIEDGSYWNIDCLEEFNISINDTAATVISAIEKVDLNIGNDKRFKVRKYKKKKLPMVFATAYMSFDIDKNITGIIENNDGIITTYLFEINQVGEIKKWCKGELKQD